MKQIHIIIGIRELRYDFLLCQSSYKINNHQSYHDLAVRLEPIILELEREQNDLLIIAHESVLRVLYGYLMACNAADIPKLEFTRDEIIEVRFNAQMRPNVTM